MDCLLLFPKNRSGFRRVLLCLLLIIFRIEVPKIVSFRKMMIVKSFLSSFRRSLRSPFRNLPALLAQLSLRKHQKKMKS